MPIDRCTLGGVLTLIVLAHPVADLHPLLILGAATVFAAELRGVHPMILTVAATLVRAVWSVI
jgi:hypothetical protein